MVMGKGVRITVVIDESGHAPKLDTDEVFLTAAYAVASKEPPVVRPRPSNKPYHDWIVDELMHLGGKPSVVLLAPERGFRENWQPKFELMAAMGKARRDKLGNPYVPPDGLTETDYLWTFCTVRAIASAVVAAFPNPLPPDLVGIDVIIDRRSLKPEHRFAAETLPKLLPVRLTEILMALAPSGPAGRAWLEWAKQVNLPAVPVTVEWYTDSPDGGPQPMSLAHRLAHQMFAEHRRGSSGDRPLTNQLLAAGYGGFLENVTNVLAKPLREEALLRWGAEMGAFVGLGPTP